MKINNKPMSALPSVADTPADTGRSCVRLFGLYTILPKVLRVVVEVLFLYRLITGFYHLEPFLRFGKHVRETVSFQQKGPPLTEWPSIIVELRGFEPLTLSMPWRCATSCAIAPMSALQTLYKIQHRAESCNSRRVGHVVEESPGRMPHRLFRSVRPIA